MTAVQVVSVFPGCGQEAFVEQNRAVNHIALSHLASTDAPWDVLRHLRNGIIRRQCSVVTMNKAVHNGLHRMGHNAILVYPTYWHHCQPVDWKEMEMDMPNWEGLKISLPVGFELEHAIRYDRDRKEFILTEKAQDWVTKT